MIIEREGRQIDRSKSFKEKGFRVKTNSAVFENLSSGLYSDKITAIIRELSCNAYDAQVEAQDNALRSSSAWAYQVHGDGGVCQLLEMLNLSKDNALPVDNHRLDDRANSAISPDGEHGMVSEAPK